MKFGPFEVFLLSLAALLVLFLILWFCEEVRRLWATRHLRKEKKEKRRTSNPGFSRRG